MPLVDMIAGHYNTMQNQQLARQQEQRLAQAQNMQTQLMEMKMSAEKQKMQQAQRRSDIYSNFFAGDEDDYDVGEEGTTATPTATKPKKGRTFQDLARRFAEIGDVDEANSLMEFHKSVQGASENERKKLKDVYGHLGKVAASASMAKSFNQKIAILSRGFDEYRNITGQEIEISLDDFTPENIDQRLQEYVTRMQGPQAVLKIAYPDLDPTEKKQMGIDKLTASVIEKQIANEKAGRPKNEGLAASEIALVERKDRKDAMQMLINSTEFQSERDPAKRIAMVKDVILTLNMSEADLKETVKDVVKDLPEPDGNAITEFFAGLWGKLTKDKVEIPPDATKYYDKSGKAVFQVEDKFYYEDGTEYQGK